MLSTFSYTCWTSEYLLWKNVYSGPLPILKIGLLLLLLLLSCISRLHILDINLLANTWFANIFSYSIGCLSFCWWFLLLCRSILVWCCPTCLAFLLLLVFWVSHPKHHCQDPFQGSCPLFSSSSMISGLTFKSSIHFEFIFVYGER